MPAAVTPHSAGASAFLRASVRRHRRARRPSDASVDQTDARYGRMSPDKQTTANEWVGVVLSGRGDWTPLELVVAGVRRREVALGRFFHR
jgi:hypothetical protein